jgi:hypothetical protein
MKLFDKPVLWAMIANALLVVTVGPFVIYYDGIIAYVQVVVGDYIGFVLALYLARKGR